MSNSIPPFPADIDRDAFGNWLSGFTDGEGCFRLGLESPPSQSPLRLARASFILNLRADDATTLQLIHSFWQCGTFSRTKSALTQRRPNPMLSLEVRKIRHLVEIVVPHFERYTLRAKKFRDFLIWKRGVALVARVYGRQFQYRATSGYYLPKWTEEERADFLGLVTLIKQQRRYNEPELPLPIQGITADRLPLFDAPILTPVGGD